MEYCLNNFDSNRYVISSIKRKNVSLVFNIFSDPHKMDMICLPSSHVFVIKDLISNKDYMSLRKPNSNLQGVISGWESLPFTTLMDKLLSYIETSCLFEIKKYSDSYISLLLNCPEKKCDITYEFERIYSGSDCLKTPNVIFFPGIYQSNKDLSDEIDQLRFSNQSLVDELKHLKAASIECTICLSCQKDQCNSKVLKDSNSEFVEETKLNVHETLNDEGPKQSIVEIKDNYQTPSIPNVNNMDNHLQTLLLSSDPKLNVNESDNSKEIAISPVKSNDLNAGGVIVTGGAGLDHQSVSTTFISEMDKRTEQSFSLNDQLNIEGSEVQIGEQQDTDNLSTFKKNDRKAKTVKLTRGDQNVILKYRRNKGAPVRRYIENPGDFTYEKMKKSKELSSDMAIFEIISISDEEYACAGGKTTMKPVQTFDNCNIEIRSTKTHEILHLLIGHQIPICNLLLLYTNTLVSGDQAGNMVVWELTNYTYIGVLKGHTDKIYEIIQLRGDLVLTCSADKRIIIWDAINYKQVAASQPFDKSFMSAFMISDTEFIGCTSNLIKKFSFDKDFQELESLIVDLKINTLARAAKKLFAVGFRNGMIRIYKIKGFELVSTLKGHTDNITKIVKLSSDLIASSSYDERLKIWNFKENVMVKSLSGQGGKMISCFKLSSNEIITSTGNEAVILWESQLS